MKNYTHDELNAIAVKWLKRPLSRNGAACHIAVSETKSGWNCEIPDAFGYRAPSEALGGSVVVEAKVTRSDFKADQRKAHRSGEVLGLGNHRFYIAPEGLIEPSELPKGWGLIEVNQRGTPKCIVGYPSTTNTGQRQAMFDDTKFTANTEGEFNILVRLLARIGDTERLNNAIKDGYKLESENKELRNQLQKYDVASLRKELAETEESPIPIPRQKVRLTNKIKRSSPKNDN
ncbi:hypothetical protein AB4254_11845 [Vibrio breoganii]